MKKVLLLVALFVVPVVAYLFFASGVNSFIKLPVVTEKIPELPINWKPLSGNETQLKNKITILGFVGNDIKYVEGNITNLAHKIYDKNKDFVDFQVVMIAPKGTEEAIIDLNRQLSVNIDLKHWHYVMADEKEIQEYFKKLNLVGGLDSKVGTSNVYIIDKELNLRGRKGKNKKGEDEYREGYNTISAADLHNEMSDDVKVILAEYRLALKKNNNKDNITN
ncbi:hypothetical protein SAMN05421741_12213 [Paenimyroides ummariense]|uniref:Uncharacterized protein n=1 Tax=Paenimyroides ummariense TaxID=913024 RepID=A0A1I5ERI4_9FLAO|nr:hypothetical protein [Paenimyroides ummariense]SFO13986.1 hypothetical protein SAMN05421741_12213 [Paenimyroides ummariense]